MMLLFCAAAYRAPLRPTVPLNAFASWPPRRSHADAPLRSRAATPPLADCRSCAAQDESPRRLAAGSTKTPLARIVAIEASEHFMPRHWPRGVMPARERHLTAASSIGASSASIFDALILPCGLTADARLRQTASSPRLGFTISSSIGISRPFSAALQKIQRFMAAPSSHGSSCRMGQLRRGVMACGSVKGRADGSPAFCGLVRFIRTVCQDFNRFRQACHLSCRPRQYRGIRLLRL